MITPGYTGRPTLLKELNTSIVLSLIKERDLISRADIAKELSLSPPTVSKIVENLLADNWVNEVGVGVSSGGRKPLLLQFNSNRNYLMGAWLGDRSIITAVSDLSGKVLLRLEEPRSSCTAAVDNNQVVAVDKTQLIRMLEQTLQEAEIPRDLLGGIGIAVCGITRLEDGTVVRGRYLPGWQDIPIAHILADHFGVPVIADGDTYLAVLGEATAGAGRGVENLVRITLGAGIGCGIIIGGCVYRGATGMAGEIGDLIVSDELSLNALAGKGGYLEEIANRNILVMKASEMMASGQETILRDLANGDATNLTLELVLQAAQKGDHTALTVVSDICETLSRAISNIISVLNPELVIVGGDLGERSDILINNIRKWVASLLYSPPPIKVSTLGRDAEIMGAIALVLEHISPSLRVDYHSSMIGNWIEAAK